MRAQQTKTDDLDDLHARLTTAETEAVELLGEYQRVDEEARVAEARVEALSEALTEVHEYHCGCDRPGNPAACVASPPWSFAALAASPVPERNE